MLGFITELLSAGVSHFDESYNETPPHQIVLATAALYFAYNQYQNPWLSRWWRSRHNNTLQQRVLDAVYPFAELVPQVKAYLDDELNKNLASIREKLQQARSVMHLQTTMPLEGRKPAEILAVFGMEAATSQDSNNARNYDKKHLIQEGDGQDSGALYASYPEELRELLKEVYARTALTNPMHEKWPRINAMQAEVISWCQELFHGSATEGYGIITHGGSTSIIEAMIAYVLRARAEGISHPEIVVPATAHAAFWKAAELTGAHLIVVPVDEKTGAVSAKTMSSYISRNTAVIVGSAPSFMNGIHDPIGELGQLAQKKRVPFHVDACLGGFLTAFCETEDEPLDFRVPGVTSISADTHKYACCPKGSSVCLFSKDSPALPVYAALNWPGGLYATAGTLDGSVSGARVAEIYATMSYYGKKKYIEIAHSIIATRAAIQQSVEQLYQQKKLTPDELSVYGNPKWSVIGFNSTRYNPHLIADELAKKGWNLNLLQNPKGFHLCITHVHTLAPTFVDHFVRDLSEAVAVVRAYPADKKVSGNVKVYGAVSMMPSQVQRMVAEQYQRARLALGRLGIFNADVTSAKNHTQKSDNELAGDSPVHNPT